MSTNKSIYIVHVPSASIELSIVLFMTYTGMIPLRRLVYRVLDLPPSMRPMVYDFGQLNMDTEKDYTKQIVLDRCRDIPLVGANKSLINAIALVLVWSQKYMRDRKVSMV